GSLRLSHPGRNHSGSYTCSAVNSFGSDSITYAVSVLVPPSAPVLHVTETTSSFVRLQWDVSDDGGSPITVLSLSYSKRDDSAVTVIVRGDSHTVYGLDCGQEYVFHIVARNAIG
ncbi:Fibronectin type III, partial [Trinorchestia longiramus]